MKLSIVISAYNEEKNIEECLKSAHDFADEIVVVDNNSTDKTGSIAKKYTKMIFKKENNPMLNVNKNFGISKATSDWILVLDADERVTDDLKAEIKNIVASHVPNSAYKIPRKNIIFGKWIEHTGWYPDYQTRLFRKGKGKFDEKHVHEQLTVDGDIGNLQSAILHDHYNSIDQFLKKTFFNYTDNEVEELIKKGYKFKMQDLISFPFNEFLNRYFARQGYKDGTHGLALSLLMAFYHLIVVLKVWEKEKFKDQQNDTRKIVISQLPQIEKELRYWNSEIEMKNMSPIRQTIERAKRKFA